MTPDLSWEDAPIIDPKTVDWPRVRSATYRVAADYRYEYPVPIRDLDHRLVIVPRERSGEQERLAQHFETTPRIESRTTLDAFGNDVISVSAKRVENELNFHYRSLVRRSAAALDRHEDASALADPDWMIPRRLTRPDEAIEDAAARLSAQHPDPFELADAVATFVHEKLTYTKGVTDVFTTASVAFAMRRGVCQDYAHVMLAVAHACGLAGRYVSGHLLGEGATHAWVELLLRLPHDDAAVLAFDPTNGVRAGLRHIVVAIGRDYDDIAPTSGTFKAAHAGVLHSRNSVDLTGVTFEA